MLYGRGLKLNRKFHIPIFEPFFFFFFFLRKMQNNVVCGRIPSEKGKVFGECRRVDGGAIFFLESTTYK